MSMFIFAMIAGLDKYATAAVVEPHDTIATLLSGLKKTLIRHEKPHEITGAYSIVHTRKEGLTYGKPDCIALEHGDPDVTAKYCTPAARLDPTKTVRFYFGTRIESEVVSIVLTWPAESLARIKRERERGRAAFRERVAAYRATGKTGPLPAHVYRSRAIETPTERATSVTPPVIEEIEETEATTLESTSSPWHWLASCLPAVAACSRWAKAGAVAHNDGKKND